MSTSEFFLSKQSILFPLCHTDVLCDAMKAETCLTWSMPGTAPETNQMKLAVMLLLFLTFKYFLWFIL